MTKWNIESMCGYKPITTFWNDFEIAEIFGKKAVIDTYPYNDRWDSSIIGFAYVEKASMAYMIGSWKAEALAAIREEVAMLDKFLQGEVYTATLEKKTHIYKEEKCSHCGEVISPSEWDDWEEVEFASGFYGYGLEENGILHDFCNGLHFKEEVRPAKMA